MYVRLSVRLPVCINAASSGRINKKLDIEDFMKVYRQIPNLVVNIGQNVGYFTWKPKYLLSLPATLNSHTSTRFTLNDITLLG